MPRTSDKPEKILAFIRAFTRRNGYPPSVREIGAAVGLRSTSTVHYQLARLREQGLLAGDAAKSRALTLADEPPRGVPLVGTVAAGQPILAEENVEGFLPWEGEDGCFALRVKGDSMLGAGILPGDCVIVRPQPDADDGEIVVALLGDEATVKRLSKRGKTVLLLPENPAYEPIDGSGAVILGKVRAVLRTY